MTDLSPPTALTFRGLISPGIESLRRYWRPFVLLQVFALLLVIGFYNSESIRAICEKVSLWKTATGLPTSALCTAIAGVILPGIAKRIVLREPIDQSPAAVRERRAVFIFSLAMFAGSGIITDLQYRLLAHIFGSGHDVRTVIEKVLTDQFITTPIYGATYFPLLFSWRSKRYRFRPWLGELRPRWYVKRVLPILLPNWSFWIPMAALIYSLPGSLQFCLFALAMAAWSMLMVVIAADESPMSIKTRT